MDSVLEHEPWGGGCADARRATGTYLVTGRKVTLRKLDKGLGERKTWKTDETPFHLLKGEHSLDPAPRADAGTNLINALGGTLENGSRRATHGLFYKDNEGEPNMPLWPRIILSGLFLRNSRLWRSSANPEVTLWKEKLPRRKDLGRGGGSPALYLEEKEDPTFRETFTNGEA